MFYSNFKISHSILDCVLYIIIDSFGFLNWINGPFDDFGFCLCDSINSDAR